MDERYWMLNDSLHALRNMAIPHMWQLELEVKLLTLRVELLRQEGEPGGFKEATSFENLRRLMQNFVTEVPSGERCREILHCIDAISTAIRERAGSNCSDH